MKMIKEFSVTSIVVAVFSVIGYQPFISYAADLINEQVNKRVDNIEIKIGESTAAQRETAQKLENLQVQQEVKQEALDQQLKLLIELVKQMQQPQN